MAEPSPSSATSNNSARRNLKHKATSSSQTGGAAGAGGSQRSKADNPIVASLSQKSPHPFSSIALSPNREYAVTARKDTLLIVKVGPLGILPFKSIPIAQHFQTKVSTDVSGHGRSSVTTSRSHGNNNNNSGNNMGRIYEDVRDNFVRDAFGYGQRTGSSQASSNNINVILTDVAWSKPTNTTGGEVSAPPNNGDGNVHSTTSSMSSSSKKKEKNPSTAKSNGKSPNKTDTAKTEDRDTSVGTAGAGTSLIAAAGSNGVIVVWSAETLLEGESGQFPAPDAILSQHARAVNRLAWHPRRPGLLLSASQDGTVILWERQRTKVTTTDQQKRQSKASTKQGGFSLFGGMNKMQSNQKRSYSWQCRATFEPKSEAVRDIQWSPFHDDGTCAALRKVCYYCIQIVLYILQ
jgi:WD40 repeat protein